MDEARADRGDASEGPRSKNNSHLGSYHDLVSTYIWGNNRHYAKLLAEMTDLLHLDGNWGLAKQLEGRLLRYRSIRKFASVYSVLGLHQLEMKMQRDTSEGEFGNRGIEDLLMGMAACDTKDPLVVDPFFTRIDQSTGMVAFLDDDDDAVNNLMEADLSTRLQSCMALAERVRDLDIVFTTSPKYLQHSVKETMTKGGDLSGAMDTGIDW